MKEYQVETIVESLCSNMISEKEQLRDISSIGLKTVIAELPQAPGGLSGSICKTITQRLTTAIERVYFFLDFLKLCIIIITYFQQEDVSVQLEALDIVADLLARFGNVLSTYHTNILNALLPQLCSQRQAVRKRTIAACSNLVLSCNNTCYCSLIEHLYRGLSGKASNTQKRTYIQCIAAVCRQSGHRFGEHIENFVEKINEYSGEEDDELREFCLQAFESFVNRCPKEITKYIPSVSC